ncbi:hypothetical protein MRX96_033466 [Rhipicephalus microplus]
MSAASNRCRAAAVSPTGAAWENACVYGRTASAVTGYFEGSSRSLLWPSWRCVSVIKQPIAGEVRKRTPTQAGMSESFTRGASDEPGLRTAGRSGVPPSHQWTRQVVATGPTEAEPPSLLERSPVVQQAEPSVRAVVQKKGTLRSFFWGTSNADKDLRRKRKKELLQQLADLQRENARLQSECDHMRLIYSELKQEHLIVQEKASRARALDCRPQSETQLMSSACQTDPCSDLLREFRAVPRKNYAFIYNMFAVPTPEQLKKSLEKFQKSGTKVGVRNGSKSDIKSDDGPKDAWESDVKVEVHVVDSEVAEMAERTPQAIVEETSEEPFKDVDEPKANARSDNQVDEKRGDVVTQTEAVDSKLSGIDNVHDQNAQDESSLGSSCHKTEKSIAVEGEKAIHVLPAPHENAVEDPTVEMKEPEVPAEPVEEEQPKPPSTLVKANATEDANVPPF